MKWIDPEGANVAVGANQEEYETINLRREIILYDFADGRGLVEVPRMVGCVELTPGEIELLRNGDKLYIAVLGNRWAPILLTVGDPQPPQGTATNVE